MQKGRNFENQIEKVLKFISDMGYHAHKNHANRNQEGVYLSGEPFDYEVFLPNKHHCFDAKECATKNWQMKDKDIKQCNNLKQCKKAGCEAYFLIHFTKVGVKQIDVDDVIKVLETGKKSISNKLGKTWILLEEIKKWGEE